jgi:DNA (cytosine-5)-methyltransferase 1
MQGTRKQLRVGEFFAGGCGMALGFHRAGWDTRWLAEIDPWLQNVARARFPGAEVLGDVRAIDARQLAEVDLVVQGSPCQDLSVAGHRRGIRRGERSALFFTAHEHWLQSGAPLMLWENVVGALHSHSGKDFGRVLSTLVGAVVPVPRYPVKRDAAGRRWAKQSRRAGARSPWPRAGVVRGPAGVAAWRVLDAQYVPRGLAADVTPELRAVAQRRLRVFVLVSRRDDLDPATILHESDLAGSGRAGGGGGPEVQPDAGIVRGDRGARGAARSEGTRAAADGAAAPESCILDPVMAFYPNMGSNARTDGFTRNIAPTLSGANGGNKASVGMIVLPFDTAQITHPENRSLVRDGDPFPTLAVHSRPHVALAWGPARSADELEVADPISANEGRTWTHEGLNNFRLHNVVFSFKPSHFTRGKDGRPSEVSHPLAADTDKGDQDPILLARAIVRRLTPIEGCRLMAWPDDWLDVPLDEKGRMPSDTRKYKAIGNGVAANVAEWLARRIDTHFTR